MENHHKSAAFGAAEAKPRPAQSDTCPGAPGPGRVRGDRARSVLWKALGLAAALALVALLAVLGLWWHKAQRITSRIQAHVASQPLEGYAIGDLGGMPVKIPRHLAELLEYDGDPGWAPAPDWLPPQRGFASKINSFGFYVRFPDGTTLDSRERREEKRLVPAWEDRWISVGVASSKHYPGDGFLQRYEQALRRSQTHKSALFRYHPQAQKEFGLEIYKLAPPPMGPDPMKLILDEEYFGRDATDRLLTNIRCTVVRADINRSTCNQVWSLEDSELRIQLTAQYRRPMLQHWREIQLMVTQIVLGFRHDPSEAAAASSAPR